MKYRNVKIKRRDLLASAGALAVSDSVSHLATDGCGNAPQIDNLPPFDTFDNASSATIPTEIAVVQTKGYRSEERRVGKECVSTCRARWSPTNSNKKKSQKKNTQN